MHAWLQLTACIYERYVHGPNLHEPMLSQGSIKREEQCLTASYKEMIKPAAQNILLLRRAIFASRSRVLRIGTWSIVKEAPILGDSWCFNFSSLESDLVTILGQI